MAKKSIGGVFLEKNRRILNMDDNRKVCVYNLEEKIYHTERLCKNKEVDRGFYAEVGDNVCGVMASEKGPIFFHNSELYYLLNLDYNFVHIHLEPKLGKFQLVTNNKIKEEIIYSITTLTDYDSWSNERDVDFFQWLYQVEESEEEKVRFHEFYTQR